MSSLLLKLVDRAEGSSARGMVTPDGKQVFSVYDFMTSACGYGNSGGSARSEFKRLIGDGSEYKNEVLASCYSLHFPGQRGPATPCMTVEGLLILLKCLGSKVSKAFQDETFSVLQRYLDGDCSMLEEIEQNKLMGKRKSYENFAERVAKRALTYTDNASNEMPSTSYIYGTKSDAFPNLVKIGRSANLTARLSTLNTSCKPMPHKIVAAAPTLDAVRDEDLAHTFFASARREGEFFEVSAADVQSFFSKHIMANYQLELAAHIATRQGL